MPVLAGYFVCRLLALEAGLAKSFFVGMLTEWTIIELISVPAAFLQIRFTVVFIILTVICLALCLGVVICFIKDRSDIVKSLLGEEASGDGKSAIGKMKADDWFAFLFMWAIVITIAVTAARVQHQDFDDATFVVNAVDIVRTDSFYRTNPETGIISDTLLSRNRQDLITSWSTYIAYVSKLTGTHCTIMAHSVLPQMLMLLVLAVYWLLSEVLFDKKVFNRSAFAAIAFLVIVYGCYSDWNANAFFLLRLWQGKAVVGSVGIPALFLTAAWIYDKDNSRKTYIPYYLTCISICMMSGSGVMAGALITGAAGVVYGALKKSWKVMLGMWLGTLICGCFFILLKLH